LPDHEVSLVFETPCGVTSTDSDIGKIPEIFTQTYKFSCLYF